MEVFLIRHTAPDVFKGFIYGRTDVGLAESFDTDKRLVIDKLPDHIDIFISSPSSRCSLLAREITDSYLEDGRLMELDFGSWEGKTWDTIDRLESEKWMSDFVNTSPPGGESLNQMNERVMGFWKELLQYPHQRIAIITHAGVIRLILSAVNSTPLQSLFDINVQYGEVINLNISSGI
ncbi:MAG: alpha-ribazole phosphatase family protein [Mucilaginibacter sp.]|uniref:alpha-ribazole phosphatase family protein n=1 Tax=Mucilaginibacter sp. TaxID=1882438 RepID=UPI0031A8E991